MTEFWMIRIRISEVLFVFGETDDDFNGRTTEVSGDSETQLCGFIIFSCY